MKIINYSKQLRKEWTRAMSFSKYSINRFLAGLMAILMIVSMVPANMITAFATSSGTEYTFVITDKDTGNNIDNAKIFSM